MTNNMMTNATAGSFPIRYMGLTNVYSGLLEYMEELSLASKHDETLVDWRNSNAFLALIHRTTKELIAIRGYKTNLPSPDDYLFSTDYVPFELTPYDIKGMRCPGDLLAIAESTLVLFETETTSMKNECDFPLFLLSGPEQEEAGPDICKAWSLAENKLLHVHAYKTYKENFGISDPSIPNPPVTVNDRYTVAIPSDELIERLRLPLFLTVLQHKQSWDKWVRREPRECFKEIIPVFYRTRYCTCIEVINRSRMKNLGHDKKFVSLENRVTTLENLCCVDAPLFMIEKEISLIERVLPALEKLS